MRRTLALLASVALAVGAALALPTPAVPTVTLPPPGTFTPTVTSDGTPVWVGHRRTDDGTAVDGDVWVVDATAPSGDVLVGHCPGTGQLVDPVTGDVFDVRGRSIVTTTDTGLAPFVVERDGDLLRLVERLPAYETLPFPSVDTSRGVTCLGPDGPTAQFVEHPAA
jgi:hypothetical protein